MKTLYRSILPVPALLLAASVALSQTSAYPGAGHASAATSSVPADNSKRNQDASNRARTADDQKENATDRTLAQRIRKSVMADKNLSTYAHNVKIVAVDGTVTLNGVVRSDKEKTAVAAMAEKVAGAGRVVNELKIQPADK